MDLKQSCNVFLPVKQYGDIKELGHKLDIPYSELIREGVDLILRKYQREEKSRREMITRTIMWNLKKRMHLTN